MMLRAWIAVVSVVLLPSVAFAQQRPLVTEDPETIGPGLVLIEAGFDVQRDVIYPASGLQGNLLRFPTLGVSIGVGRFVELQVDGGLYQRLSVTERRAAPLAGLLDFTGDRTSSFEDVTVATKIRLVGEAVGRPGVGVRLATRLPGASVGSGLGLGTTDFVATALVGKTVQSIRIVGNGGLGYVGDPYRGFERHRMFNYGFSLARALYQGVEVIGEINGRARWAELDEVPGTESRSVLRVGGRVTTGTVRVDAGLLFGLTSRDPSWGFTAGATWVFRGFNAP